MILSIQGLDYQQARTDLEIPDNFDVMAMIAIGRKGPKENLHLMQKISGYQ
jgi:hypothetical protein